MTSIFLKMDTAPLHASCRPAPRYGKGFYRKNDAAEKIVYPLSKPVIQCIDYIYSNIKERITIADLAAYTGLSESYLSRVFKQNLGVSISDYIREKKIEKATHLLRYSDKPISRYSQLPVIFITEPLYPDFRGFYGAYTKEISRQILQIHVVA